MTRAPAALIRLMRFVPQIPQRIRNGRSAPTVYDMVLRVIAKHRSAAFVEWEHLEQIVWQEQALLRAAARIAPS